MPKFANLRRRYLAIFACQPEVWTQQILCTYLCFRKIPNCNSFFYKWLAWWYFWCTAMILRDVPVKLLLQFTGMWLQSLLPTQWAGLFHAKKHSLPKWKFISPLTCLLARVSGGAGECKPTTALEPLVNNVSSIPLMHIQVREYQQAVGKSCWRSQTSFFAGYCFAKLRHIDSKFLLNSLQLRN